ncbi:hypothetical protein ACS0TY_025446 [Phlomoides rotata]
MLCGIAELESCIQPDEVKMGIMQVSSKTIEWLTRELGYMAYKVAEDSKVMNKSFLNVYLATAYLKWLSNFDQKEKSEEFMVKAYKGGTKKVYSQVNSIVQEKISLSFKKSLPSRKAFGVGPASNAPSYSASAVSQRKGGLQRHIIWLVLSKTKNSLVQKQRGFAVC